MHADKTLVETFKQHTKTLGYFSTPHIEELQKKGTKAPKRMTIKSVNSGFKNPLKNLMNSSKIVTNPSYWIKC